MKKRIVTFFLAFTLLVGCGNAQAKIEKELKSLLKDKETTLLSSAQNLQTAMNSIGGEFKGGDVSTSAIQAQEAAFKATVDTLTTMKNDTKSIVDTLEPFKKILDAYPGSQESIVSLKETVTTIFSGQNDLITAADNLINYYNEVIALHAQAATLTTQLEELQKRGSVGGDGVTYLDSNDFHTANGLVDQINGIVDQINAKRNGIADLMLSLSAAQENVTDLVRKIPDQINNLK